jgi:hypothetical protein
MGMENLPQAETREGWLDETEERRDSVLAFLMKDVTVHAENKKRYDPMIDLHYSGGSLENYESLRAGDASSIYSINALYENGELKLIHVIVSPNKKGGGGNTDVYIENKALADYLASTQKE